MDMYFADAIEKMMDARDACKAHPGSEPLREAYEAAKNEVSYMYESVRDDVHAIKTAKAYEGF